MFSKKNIDELTLKLPREELVRRSRILVVDDEKPDLIEDLVNLGFAVNFLEDITTENASKIESAIYDLILLDFGNVGKTFGDNEGLDLLRHIKRVAPSIVVLTYTSKALGTEHAEFYRQADGTLAKDAGIGDSVKKIEEALERAHSISHVWSSLLKSLNIAQHSPEDIKLQDMYVRGLAKKAKLDAWQDKSLAFVKEQLAKESCKLIVAKLIELGMKAAI